VNLKPGAGMAIPLFLAMLFGIGAAEASSWLRGAFLLFAALMLPLQAFYIWRAMRFAKIDLYRQGRLYERQIRFRLGPEYHDTEDSYLAAWRRRRHRLGLKTTPPPR
jgi:hypothetical protein